MRFAFLSSALMVIALAGCSIHVTRYSHQPAAAPETATVPASSGAVCLFGEVKRCTESCQAGSAESCNNLGAMYEVGEGVARDEARARELYSQACEAKARAACVNLERLGDGPTDKPVPPPPPPYSSQPPPAPVAERVFYFEAGVAMSTHAGVYIYESH